MRSFFRSKNRKSVFKRYRKTKSGYYIYKRPYKSHILEKKSPKRKRALGNCRIASKGDSKNIIRMLPY